MMATFDPGTALCFAAAIFLFVLAVGIPAAFYEWREHMGRASKQREEALIKLHVYAHQLQQLVAAQRVWDQAA